MWRSMGQNIKLFVATVNFDTFLLCSSTNETDNIKLAMMRMRDVNSDRTKSNWLKISFDGYSSSLHLAFGG